MKAIGLLLTAVLLLIPSASSLRENGTITLSEIEREIEKKPWAVGGYLEVMPKVFRLDHDAAFYRLNFYDQPEKDILDEYNLRLSMEGEYTRGMAEVYLRSNVDARESAVASDRDVTVDEGFLSLRQSPLLNISIGKKVLKWGQGYAWNPVAFVGRPKNPDDPDLALEGYIVATADYIKSFSGPLQAFSVTPVVIPVYEHINTDFGTRNHLNYACKLYLLLYDTDIYFMMLRGGSRPSRLGADVSRNITTNFEIHGEIAYVDDIVQKTVDGSGRVTETSSDAASYLFGIRYLTESETTFICEYYRNGTGFSGDAMEAFYDLVEEGFLAYRASGDDTLLKKVRAVTEGNYGRSNPMKDYLYLRIMQKDPFDILYLTPSVASIYNVSDKSFSFSPEVLYTGITNLELRLKAGFIVGDEKSEFGEKQNDYRIELRVRYYFDVTPFFE